MFIVHTFLINTQHQEQTWSLDPRGEREKEIHLERECACVYVCEYVCVCVCVHKYCLGFSHCVTTVNSQSTSFLQECNTWIAIQLLTMICYCSVYNLWKACLASYWLWDTCFLVCDRWDPTLPLRHPLLISYDCCIVSCANGAFHAALPQTAGMSARKG